MWGHSYDYELRVLATSCRVAQPLTIRRTSASRMTICPDCTVYTLRPTVSSVDRDLSTISLTAWWIELWKIMLRFSLWTRYGTKPYYIQVKGSLYPLNYYIYWHVSCSFFFSPWRKKVASRICELDFINTSEGDKMQEDAVRPVFLAA